MPSALIHNHIKVSLSGCNLQTTAKTVISNNILTNLIQNHNKLSILNLIAGEGKKEVTEELDHNIK
jgi:hypothetical protein